MDDDLVSIFTKTYDLWLILNTFLNTSMIFASFPMKSHG